MWCRQNEDTSWTICEAFLIDKDFGKRKKPRGFAWEASADVINGYLAHNADLTVTELGVFEYAS